MPLLHSPRIHSPPTGWLARPVTTSVDLKSGNEVFYRVDYNRDTWSGDALAHDINDQALVQTTGPWDNNDPTLTTAATLLDNLNFDTGRKIVTRNGSTNIPFRWASLSAAQQASIGNPTNGPKILDFVRGDRSNEEPNGVSFHAREHVMGDTMHSTLHFWKHDASTKRLYVGANDGMLHVFNADTGAEVFAYIPSMVIPNLKKLTSKPYVHTHFVDGPIAIANVDFSGTVKTILVGGLGAGGKGLYALDISNPSPTSEAVAASKIKWEITAAGSFADLGYTYAAPKVARLNNNTPVVIVGNGYVNSGNGHAILYIINLDTGALISALDTNSGSTANPNGLSSPSLLDIDRDGKVEYAYAGDIDGNLWKFDLKTNSATLLFTTSPPQAITVAPALFAHPYGGVMVAFATGRILTTGDLSDTSVHYAYGIWDEAPADNDQLLTQTLTLGAYGTGAIRTITDKVPDWTAGTGHHKGWKVALPAGERTVGEAPFYNNLRYYFLSTNPTIVNPKPPKGENWLNEIEFITGGSPKAPVFDLNKDNAFNDSDLADGCTKDAATFVTCIPVSKYLGSGVFSQATLVDADGFSTTLYAFHPDLPTDNGTVIDPPDPGVSGGHFDFDIYYYGASTSTTTEEPTLDSETNNNICKKIQDVEKEYNKVPKDAKICTSGNGFSSGYVYMTAYTKGSKCDKDEKDPKKQKYYFTVTCNTVTTTTSTSSTYGNHKHVHEYDDKYDVTGVNMLNASDPAFNLANVLPDTTTQFKILVMNQYLNPAAKLSVGGANYENVKTYGNLASETDAPTLLAGLPTYTRSSINTLIYNLPLDAFKSKDWWGDGGAIRAGLIPTQTGCVNKVNSDGSMENTSGKGRVGPNGERFDGALTIQLIKASTPASALELNHNSNGSLTVAERVKYGWRIKQAEFTNYVLAEYTSFWHNPNKFCYGDSDWVPDAPEDYVSDATAQTPAAGSADPKDGVFSAGLAVIDTTTTVNGGTTTTVVTYSDNSTYTKTEVKNSDGTITITQVYRDGTSDVTVINGGSGNKGSFIDPSKGSPEEDSVKGKTGRQTWRELFN